MGIEDANVRFDEPDDQAKRQPESDRNPPANQSEPPEQGSGVGKRATPEADDGATSQEGRLDRLPAMSGSGAEPVDQRFPEKPGSSLEERPSYGRFGNLAHEFDARARSRDNAKTFNKTHELPGSRLDEKAIREQIAPYVPDIAKTEGGKEKFQRTVREKDSVWTDGLDSFDDLPTGEKLGERDEDRRSRSDRFLGKVQGNADGIGDRLEKIANKAADFFKPPPTAQAETRVPGGPVAVDGHHSGLDPGSAVTAVLAAGIFGAELFRRSREKIKGRAQ